MASLGLLGVPSSSAAHWPGQEKAPAALRAAGLTALLVETGHTVIDHGDRPVVRWRPHPHQRRPHDLTRTLDVLRDARSHGPGWVHRAANRPARAIFAAVYGRSLGWQSPTSFVSWTR